MFAVSGPCPVHDPPKDPSADFKAKCYGGDHSASSALTVSWLAVLALMLLALLSF